MKRHIILSILCLAPLLTLSAQEEADKLSPAEPVIPLDSLRYTIKMRELNNRREALQQRIKQEDSRRGTIIPDATPAQQEAAIMEQDSICLALRSELVEVNLAIDELTSQGISTTTATPALPDASTISLPTQPNTRPSLRDMIDSVRK